MTKDLAIVGMEQSHYCFQCDEIRKDEDENYVALH